MATAVLQKTEEKTGTWGSIFPTEQASATQSALFVKRLLALTVSNIAYLRAIFPEHSFGDRSLEGLNLKILREDVACPGACQVIKWVKGCFDAFDKKYLRALIIGFYVDPEDPDTVIESYIFRFTYKENGGIDIYRNNEKISEAHSESETRKATIRLLRTILVLTQTLESLPDDVLMTMKLLYYDEVTPQDYEPPGFKSAENDNFTFYDEPTTIVAGDVSTLFHCLKVRVKTGKRQFEVDGEGGEVENSQRTSQINTGLDVDAGMEDSVKVANTAQSLKMREEEEALKHLKSKPATSEEASVPTESPSKPGADENAVDTLGSQASQGSDAEDFTVRCPCGCNMDDGLMILCAECKFWQHGVCFLVLDEGEAPETHLCDVCALKYQQQEPSDPYLLDLSPLEVQATCLWRRALVSCLDLNRLLAPVLAKRLGTEVTVAQGLMNRLSKEGYLKTQGKGKKLGKVVNKEKVQTEGIPKYFTKTEWKGTEPVVVEKQLPSQPQSDDKENHENYMEQDEVTSIRVEEITSKTKDLKLKQGKLSRKKGKVGNKQMMLNSAVSSCDSIISKATAKTTSVKSTDQDEKRRGRKRVLSKSNAKDEFEVTCSQDVYEVTPARKKKASVVAKDIMV